MAINVTLPSQSAGSAYKQCVTLKGTGPFSLVKTNLGSSGTAEIVGDQLCVSIPSPKGRVEFAATVAGSCSGCDPVTVTASIGFAAAAECPCDPIVWPNNFYCIEAKDDGSVYQLIEFTGTAKDMEFCGDEMPNCLTAKFIGNSVIIKGKLKGVSLPLQFPLSIKNSCDCECANVTIGVTDKNSVCLPPDFFKD